MRTTKRKLNELTEREIEIACLIGRGYTQQNIADKLCIEYQSVKSALHTINTKLHITSQTQLALYTLRSGLVTLDDVNFGNEAQSCRIDGIEPTTWQNWYRASVRVLEQEIKRPTI